MIVEVVDIATDAVLASVELVEVPRMHEEVVIEGAGLLRVSDVQWRLSLDPPEATIACRRYGRPPEVAAT